MRFAMLMLTSKFLEYQRFIVLHNDPIHLWNSSVASEHHRHLNLILVELAPAKPFTISILT